jgi:hypothetical protein
MSACLQTFVMKEPIHVSHVGLVGVSLGTEMTGSPRECLVGAKEGSHRLVSRIFLLCPLAVNNSLVRDDLGVSKAPHMDRRRTAMVWTKRHRG